MFGHGDLLIVDRIIGMQSDVATETITSLLLKIGHCDDQFAAVEQITVHLAGGTLVIADMSVIDDERAHFRPQIDVSILADGGHPSEIAADEILHFLCSFAMISSLSMVGWPAACNIGRRRTVISMIRSVAADMRCFTEREM